MTRDRRRAVSLSLWKGTKLAEPIIGEWCVRGKKTHKRQAVLVGWLWIGALAIGLAPTWILPPRAVADGQGWVLTQKSTTLGDQYVYISTGGLKIVNPKAGFALATSAPDWNITLYNDKTKVYYETTLTKWRKNFDRQGRGAELSGHGWTKGPTSTIAGLKATQYVMSGGGIPSTVIVKGKRAAGGIVGAELLGG